MKKITIFQDDSNAVLYDQDEENISSYSKRLVEVLENSNVTILEFSNSIILIRPSKISSILIEEVIKDEERFIESKLIEEDVVIDEE